MKRKFFIKAVLCLLFAAILPASIGFSSTAGAPLGPNDVNNYRRTWEYLNFTMLLSPNWAYTIMPGHRYELSNDKNEDNEGVGNQFYELFTGPTYINKINDNVTFKLSLWYYYMGFPNVGADDKDYFYSHNFELIPTFDVRLGNFFFSNRIILHNKFYANNSLYETEAERRGFSLLLREMVTFGYFVHPSLMLLIGDEVFVGLIHDTGTSNVSTPTAGGEPFFERDGFTYNRIYIGFLYKYSPEVSFQPQYMQETRYEPTDGYQLKARGHYAMLTVSYVMKMY